MQSSGSTYRCNRQHLDTAPDLDKTAELPETNIRKELPIHLSSQAPTSKTRSEGNQLQPSPKKLHSVESRSTPSPRQSSPKAHHSEESCTRFDFGHVIQLFLLLSFPLFQLISSVLGISSSKNREKRKMLQYS